jgi:hypothetical protein
MKIPIQPVTVFVPVRGKVTATHVEVSVAAYVLGRSAKARYVLQEEVPATGEAKEPTYRNLVSGDAALTPLQFAAWGDDDAYFASAIAGNIGLTPITKA